MSFVPEGDTTNYNTLHKKGGGKNHPYTMKQTLKIKREVGFLYTNKQRALLQKVNTLLPESYLVE